ncbi:UNVERIFIED_CONTAM: hypothetical protein RMT77_014396 [Armadillidium vulgare]
MMMAIGFNINVVQCLLKMFSIQPFFCVAGASRGGGGGGVGSNQGDDSGAGPSNASRTRPDTSNHHANDDNTLASLNDDGGEPGGNVEVDTSKGTPILDDSRTSSSSITPEGNKRGVIVSL